MQVKVQTSIIALIVLLSLSASGAVGTGYTYTFDDASSASQVQFDFGSPSTTYSIGWSPLNAGGGSPGSGSVALALGLSTIADQVAYGTFYMAIPGDGSQNFSSWSFDLQVDPASSEDVYGGYGLLEAVTVLPSFTAVYFEELGNPNLTTSNLAGTWEHINIDLAASNTGNNLSQIGFFLIDTPDRNINGNVTFYVDNVVLVPVPEPSTGALSILGGMLTVLCRSRRLK